MSGLPHQSNWPRVKFGDVVQLSKARSSNPLADGYDRYVGLEHIEPEDLRIRRWGNVADGVTFTSIFKPGQVLFGKRRAYQRKVAVAEFSGVCSGDIYVLESKDPHTLLPALLPFICQTESFFQHAVGTSAGSLSPRTNWSSLAGFEFSLPPVEEQRGIVDLLLVSAQLKDSYKRLEIQCKLTYRAAIDDLMREALGNKCYTSYADATLPLTLAGKLTDCKHLTPNCADNGIAMVAPGNIKWGPLDLSRCKTVEASECERLMDHVSVSVGDLVMGRNQNFGVASYVTDLTPFVLGQDTVLIQSGKMPSHYLYMSLRSTFVQQQISRLSIGTTFKRINLENIRQIRIPKATPELLCKAKSIWINFEENILTVNRRSSAAHLHCSKIVNSVIYGGVQE